MKFMEKFECISEKKKNSVLCTFINHKVYAYNSAVCVLSQSVSSRNTNTYNIIATASPAIAVDIAALVYVSNSFRVWELRLHATYIGL